ncbi:MAG: discoidin domain-containing protein [Thermoguttaceae bacterium]
MRIVSCVFVLCAFVLCGAETSGVADYQQMVIDDWLTQARVRLQTGAANTHEGEAVTREDDAAGAVDGVANGEWGFHTENEPNPWWEVDLGERVTLGTLRVFNRCDQFGQRNNSLIVLVSDDHENWAEIWRNDGKTFGGGKDNAPLEVVFGEDVAARFVRLTLPTTSYFHLDEVEVYPRGSTSNVALGKPATQSSTSQWSKKTSPPLSTDSEIWIAATHRVLESGRKLAADLRTKGINTVAAEKVFDEVSQQTSPTRDDYIRLRQAVRTLALSNPILSDFREILFVKNAPSIFPHASDQYYCWWQRGGGAVCTLRFDDWNATPTVVNLTESWDNGTFFRPSISADGTRALFAYAKFDPKLADCPDKTDKKRIAEESFFHIFEMELATGTARQLTFGKYDDFDARYLPNGDIVFLSTRKGADVQTAMFDAVSMRDADRPNSYVRCGGDNFRPVPVFSLHSLDANGNAYGDTIRQISAFENFEWTPTVMNDGRIAYSRWDYIDRFNGHFFSLWAANPDGTKSQLLYGNYTVKPQVVYEPAVIPGSSKLMFVASAHHSNFGGSLVILDRNKGSEFDAPIERITPDVVFPETEGWASHYYANPHPLSEDYYIVSWSDRRLPPHCRVSNEEENPSNSMGIYYLDRFGNLELLYRDAAISSMNPIPVCARAMPPAIPSEVDWAGPREGVFLIQDVYDGLRSYGFTAERRDVRRLRIVGTLPKVQPHMNTPSLGVSSEETGKFVLGTVPVESDGSAYFRVPSGVPYFFQALNEDGVAIQTMRSLTYLMPGEQATCIGCHESRQKTPLTTEQVPLALLREPSRVTLDPSGSFPLTFSELVQPVLDARCVECHAPESRASLASKLDLTSGKAYNSLMTFDNENLRHLAFERDRSIPGEATAMKSTLLAILTDPAKVTAHRDFVASSGRAALLEPNEMYRLIVWMDLYAQRQGSFSDAQDRELIEFQKTIRNLLETNDSTAE